MEDQGGLVNLILKIRFGSTIECVWPKLNYTLDKQIGQGKALQCPGKLKKVSTSFKAAIMSSCNISPMDFSNQDSIIFR